VGIPRILVCGVARMEMGFQYRIVQRKEVFHALGAFGHLAQVALYRVAADTERAGDALDGHPLAVQPQ